MGGDRRLIIAMALVIAIVALLIASLDSGFRNAAADLVGYGGRHSDDHAGKRHLFHTGADIRGTKNGETYAQYDSRRDRSSTVGFMGFGCIGTCAELEAGYRWGQENRPSRPKECGGSTWGFLEGCVAFVAPDNIEP